MERAPLATRTVLVHMVSLMLLALSRSTGVTHWKLQDNAIIVPATSEVGAGSQEGEYVTPNIQIQDPEFAVLLSHTYSKGQSKRSSHSQRGACPFVKFKPQQASGCPKEQCAERPKCSAPRNPDGSGVM